MFHYGSFNPRFLGIRLRFDRQSYLAHVANLESMGSVNWDALPDTVLGVIGVIEHETKHFHDSLLSCLLSNIFWLRFTLFLNGHGALECFGKLSGNSGFFPAKNWITASRNARSGHSERLRSALREEIDLPDIPYISGGEWDWAHDTVLASSPDLRGLSESDKFVRYCLLAIGVHEQIKRHYALAHAAVPHFSVRDVFEMGAYSVQAIAVRRNASVHVLDRFVSALEFRDSGPGSLFRHVVELWHEKNASVQRNLCADLAHCCQIASWAILGDTYREREAAYPHVRLHRLLEAWRAGRGLNPDGVPYGKTAYLWDKWDAELGCKPWRQAVESAKEGGNRRLEKYSKSPYFRDQVGRRLMLIAADYADLQRKAIGLLLSDPDGFAVPGRYFDSEWGNSIKPPALIINFRDVYQQVKNSELSQNNVHYWTKQTLLGALTYKYLQLLSKEKDHSRLDAFRYIHEVGSAIDLFLTGERVEDYEEEWIRNFFAAHFNKRLYRI